MLDLKLQIVYTIVEHEYFIFILSVENGRRSPRTSIRNPIPKFRSSKNSIIRRDIISGYAQQSLATPNYGQNLHPTPYTSHIYIYIYTYMQTHGHTHTPGISKRFHSHCRPEALVYIYTLRAFSARSRHKNFKLPLYG